MSDMIKSNIIYSLPEKERALLQAQEANLSQYPQNILFTNDPICNLEIYSEDEYLETIVNVDYHEVGGSWYEDNVGIEKGFRVNVPLILQQNGYTEGYFRVRVSFTIDLLGEAFNNQVYIKDISQDRTEVELGAIDPENSAVIDADGNPNSQFQKFVDLGGISSTGNKLIFNLKTATGKSYPIINQYYFDTTGLSRTSHTSPPNIPNSVFSVAVKLLEPIPAQLKKLEKVWVDIDVVPPRDIFVKLQKRYQDTEEYTSLAKPNFHAQYQGQFREGNTTNYLSSNDLLGTQQNVKDRIISEVLSPLLFNSAITLCILASLGIGSSFSNFSVVSCLSTAFCSTLITLLASFSFNNWIVLVVVLLSTMFFDPSMFVVSPNIVNSGGFLSVSNSGLSAW